MVGIMAYFWSNVYNLVDMKSIEVAPIEAQYPDNESQEALLSWSEKTVRMMSEAEISSTFVKKGGETVQYNEVDPEVFYKFWEELSSAVSGETNEDDVGISRQHWNEVFTTAIEKYVEHPEVAHKLLDALYAEFAVDSLVMAKVSIDAIGNPKTDEHLREDIFTGLTYQLGQGQHVTEALAEYTVECVRSSDDVYKVSTVIEFLSNLSHIQSSTSNGSEVAGATKVILERIKETPGVSYFILQRIAELETFAEGGTYVRQTERRGADIDIEKYTAEAQGAILTRLDKTPEEKAIDQADIIDYAHMMSVSTRKAFEEKLGLEFEWLYPEERLYLLRFLKHSDEARVDKVAEFFAKYSLAGIRTFIALDYDASIGDKILEYGLSHEDDEELFIHFDELMEQTNIFAGQIGSATQNETGSTDDGRMLQNQVKEALVRKTKDVLLASIDAEAYGLHEQQGKDAMKGMLFATHIVNEFFSENPTYTTEAIQMPEGQMNQFMMTDLFGKKYKLKFNVRERAAAEGQARMNIEVHFDTENPNEDLKRIFAQETQWLNNPKRKNPQQESVFRFGFDLDTHNTQNPILSLDVGRAGISSIKREATGDTLGNTLAKVSKEATHSQYSFDKRFADPELFATLAVSFREFIASK